ncbi:hypothetical protein [Streptomyces sp. NPDC001500]
MLELVAPDDSHVPALRPLPEDALPPQEVAGLPVLPEAAARVLHDLELLRAGLVPAERLHPSSWTCWRRTAPRSSAPARPRRAIHTAWNAGARSTGSRCGTAC